MKLLKRYVAFWVALSLAAINWLVLMPTAVYACSCAQPGSPQQELGRSTAVFAGKVTAMDARDGLSISSADPVNVTFQVSEVWKGPAQRILTVQTARSGVSCGYSFATDKEYLVYANGSETNLEVFLCSRTAPLITAVDDLSVLGAGVIPTSGSGGSVTSNFWLPAAFFMLLGAFLIGTGLFTPQLNHRLGMGERSRLFTHPRFQRSAYQTEIIGRAVQVLLGLGLLLQGIANSIYPHAILNIVSFLFLGLAILGLLAMVGTTLRNWRA